MVLLLLLLLFLSPGRPGASAAWTFEPPAHQHERGHMLLLIRVMMMCRVECCLLLPITFFLIPQFSQPARARQVVAVGKNHYQWTREQFWTTPKRVVQWKFQFAWCGGYGPLHLFCLHTVCAHCFRSGLICQMIGKFSKRVSGATQKKTNNRKTKAEAREWEQYRNLIKNQFVRRHTQLVRWMVVDRLRQRQKRWSKINYKSRFCAVLQFIWCSHGFLSTCFFFFGFLTVWWKYCVVLCDLPCDYLLQAMCLNSRVIACAIKVV